MVHSQRNIFILAKLPWLINCVPSFSSPFTYLQTYIECCMKLTVKYHLQNSCKRKQKKFICNEF